MPSTGAGTHIGSIHDFHNQMNKYLITLLSIILPLPLMAATATVSAKTKDKRTVQATALTPYIIRVDNYAKDSGPAPVQSVLALEARGDEAIMNADGLGFVTTAGIHVSVDKKGALTIGTKRPGTTIFDSGSRELLGNKQQISIGNTSSGSFYGAGERGHSYNLRGDTLVMYNRQNYGYTGKDPRISQMGITMPLFLASEGYAIVFDDYAAAEMILSNPIKYTSESDKPISYYYIGACDNLAELTEELTELTGRQPLPPIWALGYINSKYGYRTRQETEAIVDSLKSAGYPLDAVVLDLYWYGNERDMGRLDWEPTQWPDPEGMMKGLKDKGINLIAISQPYILRNGNGLDNYLELLDKGLMLKNKSGGAQEVKIWVGEGGMFDMANDSTRAWLTDRYRRLTDMGMGGWWGDLGEPEVHPGSGVHANGLTARQYHNKYGNDWSKIIADLYANQYPDRRLMTMMRGGTTGLQRYSVFPWSTDVSRSWAGLEPQIRIMLNSGLSGLGYMSSDLGGFAVDPDKPYQPELYVRWLQAGLFSPVFRTHAQEFAEPIKYPQYESILKEIVKERYRWLPYNYTLAYENAAFGLPLVRPLDFRSNKPGRYDKIHDEFLWGDNVLVAPVMTEGALSRNIVFPSGMWFDWNNPARRYTGSEKNYPAPLDRLPLFVRAGSFIPLADYPMENTGDYRADMFTVKYFPMEDVEGHYTLYDDNRLSPGNLATKQYRLINFTGTQHSIAISSEGSYEGAPETVQFHFYVITDPVRSVRANGRKIPFEYDRATGILSFTVDFHCPDTLNIQFK